MKTNINFQKFAKYFEAMESLNLAQASKDINEIRTAFSKAYTASKIAFADFEKELFAGQEQADRAKQLFSQFKKLGKEKGLNFSKAYFCRELGLARNTFYQKSKNLTWTEEDLQKIEALFAREKGNVTQNN